MSFKIAMQKLLADANRWDHISDVLTTMHTDCATLHLESSSFSFLGGDCHDAYEDVRLFVQKLAHQGSKAATGGANALREVHTAYEDTDNRAKENMRAKWQWT